MDSMSLVGNDSPPYYVLRSELPVLGPAATRKNARIQSWMQQLPADPERCKLSKTCRAPPPPCQIRASDKPVRPAPTPSYPEIVRLLLLLTLAAVLPAATNDERRTAHPRIYALTDLARSAPPEFAARGLLQLLDANTIPTPEWQQEIAREVLTLSQSARHPVRKRLAPGLTATDNRAMLWYVAYNQGLDTLSLSLRAIAHLHRHNPDAARQAFLQLPRPTLANPACPDPLIPYLTAYYATAATIKANPLPLIESLQTHAELAPALELIFKNASSNEDLDTLSGALARKLRDLPASDRAFNAALFDTPSKLAHLYKALTARERPTAPLADAWAAWMRTGLEAPACQESRNAGPQQQARHDAFDLLNATLPQPLPAELLKPTGEAVPTNFEPFAENDATREQASQFRQLLFGEHSRALSNAEKDTPEWREQLQKYIQSIEARTRAASESDIEYFYRQSQLWAGVLMVAPAGPTRDRALQQFLSFLLANAPHIDPIIWFSQLESMAEITRSLHGAEFARLCKALLQTGHPVLQLYAELETAYPTRPQAN